jgi:hypothetical protein
MKGSVIMKKVIIVGAITIVFIGGQLIAGAITNKRIEKELNEN